MIIHENLVRDSNLNIIPARGGVSDMVQLTPNNVYIESFSWTKYELHHRRTRQVRKVPPKDHYRTTNDESAITETHSEEILRISQQSEDLA